MGPSDRIRLLVMTALTAAGCSAFASLDGFSNARDGDEPDHADATVGENAVDAAEADDGTARADAADACRTPVAIVDQFDGGLGETCRLGDAVKRDNLFAGLDRLSDQAFTTIAGRTVTACLRADFGAVTSPSRVVVRAKAVEAACSRACGSGCGGGYQALIFAGQTVGDDYFLKLLDVTTSFEDHEIPVDAPTRYVVVCRTSFGYSREDIGVDVIELCD